MPDYLLEIGTEELPAGYLASAQTELKQLFADALQNANLPFKSIRAFGTPRRLAVIISGLADKQETTSKKVKGPPVDKCFDEHGQPNQQANGFAAKHSLTVEQLDREDIGGVKYLVANLTIHGKPVAEILSEIAPNVVHKLPAERPMRWGASDMKFSRPIRWIVSLLDQQVVSFKLEGLVSGRESRGHRILNPGLITIGGADTYATQLLEKNVMVDPEERQKVIVDQVTEVAGQLKGKPKQLGGALLAEVVNLTEWPKAVFGEFEPSYLDLPDTLIETVMVHHQRYFPVEKADAKEKKDRVIKNDLLPYFITISNNDRLAATATIKQGNERVLRARLADGRFFYFDDQKVKLENRKEALAQLTFQDGLGSYADKVGRLEEISRLLCKALSLEPRLSMCLERTATLCKLDLVTNLVRELPELQGYVGSWYAEQDGQPPDVVRAIASHYSPRSTEDAIPRDTVGMFASVLDKIDNLVGLFALGKKPSGSSDPFALRRQAQGLVDILVDGLTNYPVNLTEVIDLLLETIEPSVRAAAKGPKREFDPAKVKGELMEFLGQRLKGKLLDRGFGREVADAVLQARDPFLNLPDVVVRCQVLENLIKQGDGFDLVRAGVRVGNILTHDSGTEVDPALFVEDAEGKLWETFKQKIVSPWQGTGEFHVPKNELDYERLVGLLKGIVQPTDEFFEQVMVNDSDKAKRDNRHGLLSQINRYFEALADFPKLQSLLP